LQYKAKLITQEVTKIGLKTVTWLFLKIVCWWMYSCR